ERRHHYDCGNVLALPCSGEANSRIGGGQRAGPLPGGSLRGLHGAADADGTADVRGAHALGHAVLVLGGRTEGEWGERLLADRERGLVGADGEGGGSAEPGRHAARDETESHAGNDRAL